MSDKPYSCSTCPHFDKFFDGCELTFYKNKQLGKICPTNESARWLIEKVGCLSHPEAKNKLYQHLLDEINLYTLTLEENITLCGTIYDQEETEKHKNQLEIVDKIINKIKKEMVKV